MASAMSLLSEAELHGLVDGHVAPERRADILYRMAASAPDRERVATWQEQGDLIRDLFRGVEREALPSSLDLRTPTYVIAAGGGGRSASAAIAGDRPDLTAADGAFRRWRRLEIAATALIISAGLASAWVASASWQSSRAPTASTSHSFEESLAKRAIAALAIAVPAALPIGDRTAMPTTSIPDLSAFGFAFRRAEALSGAPMIFHYSNAAAEQIAIAVTRAPRGRPDGVATTLDDAFVWHSGARAYSMVGNLARERLRPVVVSLRGSTVDE